MPILISDARIPPLLRALLTELLNGNVPPDSITLEELTDAIGVSLGKADTAYQLPEDGITAADLATAITDSLALADSAYQLDEDGVPESDLHTDVTAKLIVAAANVAAIATPGTATAEDCATKINAILTALKGATNPLMTPDA